jgi:hypothetical protein
MAGRAEERASCDDVSGFNADPTAGDNRGADAGAGTGRLGTGKGKATVSAAFVVGVALRTRESSGFGEVEATGFDGGALSDFGAGTAPGGSGAGFDKAIVSAAF